MRSNWLNNNNNNKICWIWAFIICTIFGCLSKPTALCVKLTGIVSIPCPVPQWPFFTLSLCRFSFTPSLQGHDCKVAWQSKSGRSNSVFTVSAHRLDWSGDRLQVILWVLMLNVGLMDFRCCWGTPQSSCLKGAEVNNHQKPQQSRQICAQI